ncbi:MAG: DUF1559 domain-containing protein [Planctomycetes bacterium]|nr:DUF1559 domain-containing protein [Planctomycetota bacterium]
MCSFSSCGALDAVGDAARKNQAKSNLKNLGMGIHHYCSAHAGNFPTVAVVYKKEKPRLSWRVHVLPYIEQEALYQKFHLDEAWDSEHNKKLIEEMPPLFAAPTSKVAGEGKTVYLAVTGKGTAFEKDAKVSLDTIPDGSSSTILLVEASDEAAVIWTKPDDWQFNPDQPLDGLVGQYKTGFLVLFADTAAREIPASVDEDLLRRMVLRNDGKPVNLDDLGP